MSEVWIAAVVTVGGSVISGMGAEKKDKKDKQFQKEMTAEEAKFMAQQTGYERALDDFYTEKGRFEKQRGLDEFRKFSTTKNYAPEYTDTAARVVMPTAPDYNTFAPAVPQPAEGGGGNTGRSTLDKMQDFSLGHKLFGI